MVEAQPTTASHAELRERIAERRAELQGALADVSDHAEWLLTATEAQLAAAKAELERVKKEGDALLEWKSAILGLVQSFGQSEMQWVGDKTGWGAVFEWLKYHLQENRQLAERLRESEAAAGAMRGVCESVLKTLENHRVPQTIEDAAVQVTFQLGPAIEGLRRAISTDAGRSLLAELAESRKQEQAAKDELQKVGMILRAYLDPDDLESKDPRGWAHAAVEEIQERGQTASGFFAELADVRAKLAEAERELDSERKCAIQSHADLVAEREMYEDRIAELKADRDRLTVEVASLAAKLASAEAEDKRLRDAIMREGNEIEQALGKALGYPPLYPDASPVDDGQVCVGDHVPVTLAMEAADRIRSLAAEVDRLKGACVCAYVDGRFDGRRGNPPDDAPALAAVARAAQPQPGTLAVAPAIPGVRGPSPYIVPDLAQPSTAGEQECRQGAVSREGMPLLALTPYHLVNLRWLLRCAYSSEPLPHSLNTGDWCGELLWEIEQLMLDFDVTEARGWRPNVAEPAMPEPVGWHNGQKRTAWARSQMRFGGVMIDPNASEPPQPNPAMVKASREAYQRGDYKTAEQYIAERKPPHLDPATVAEVEKAIAEGRTRPLRGVIDELRAKVQSDAAGQRVSQEDVDAVDGILADAVSEIFSKTLPHWKRARSAWERLRAALESRGAVTKGWVVAGE